MKFLRNRPLIITIFVIFILILLIVATSRGASTGKISYLGGVFVPVQRFFYQISDNINKAFGVQKTEEEVLVQNRDYEKQLDELKNKYSDYDEILSENERLTDLLNYKQDNPQQELKLANITGKGPGNWFEVFTIDLGEQDGVKSDMPVITADGVVGRVEEVGLNWSKVMAIVDGRSGVSAIMERTRDVGVVRGSVTNDKLDILLYMNYLPTDADIVVGDKILTSGLDGLYPKGLTIGSVLDVSDKGLSGKEVRIRPAADFTSLEEVFVVMEVQPESLPGTQQSAVSVEPQPAASADVEQNGESQTAVITGEEQGGQ